MKKILAILLSICVIFSFGISVMAEQPKTFTDVDPASDVGKDIQKLFNAGIINGNGDGTFAPQNPVTRAELCKMVNNLKGYKTPAEIGFTDVTSDKWYYTHVLIGKQAGYINGFPDGTFRGDEYITREQVCAIICRAFGIYDLGISAGITDGVSDWALPYVNALVTNKLIKLEDGNTFRATEPMKRGELSTSLSNFVISAPATTPSTGGTTGGGTGSGTGGGTSWGGNGGNGGSGGTTIVPGGSETTNPGGGETITPGGGETTNPGGGETTSPGGGETTTPGGGETTTPGGGETTTPGGGETTTPGGGETTTPGGGETTTPPTEPEEMTREEIIAANKKVVDYLKEVKTGLENSKGTAISYDFTDESRDIVEIVYKCVKDAIEVGEAGNELISKDYVYEVNGEKIAGAKKIYYEEMSPGKQTQFKELIMYKIPNPDTQQFLLDMFL